VRLARIEWAGRGEVQVFDPGFAQARAFQIGELGA
jgi:hypothetical protein